MNKLQTQLTFFVNFLEFILGDNTEQMDLFPVIFLYCWKSSEVYQDATATSDEPSTYQELAVTLPKTELP